MKPLDKKDIILINELKKDGRASYSSLAEKVDLSVPATSTRVERLIKEGIIENFTINVDYSLLTQEKSSKILLKVNSRLLNLLAEELYAHPLIKKVEVGIGEYNLIAETFPINDASKKVLMQFLQEKSEIERIELIFVYDGYPEKNEISITEPENILLKCDYCKRDFSGSVFSKVINKKKRYFCCNTCLTEYEKAVNKELKE